MDDDAIVVTADTSDTLIDRTTKAVSIVASVYRRFKLDWFYSPGRSEALVAFRGRGAKINMIKLAASGSTLDLDDGKIW